MKTVASFGIAQSVFMKKTPTLTTYFCSLHNLIGGQSMDDTLYVLDFWLRTTDAELISVDPLPDAIRAATSRRAHGTEDAGWPGPCFANETPGEPK
jgi:hypothetical protein